MRIVTSPSAAARLDAAREFLSNRPPATELLIVAASRGAADELARAVARRSGSTFGLTRFSLTQLAARAAAVRLAGARRVPGTQAGAEAIAARAAFDAVAAGELEYFAPVASMPGFPKALARTLHELRLAGLGSGRLTANAVRLKADTTYGIPFDSGPANAEIVGESDKATADLGRLLARLEEHLDRAAIDDRAALFQIAAESCRAGGVRWAEVPIVLLDVPFDSRAERDLVEALVSRSPDILA